MVWLGLGSEPPELLLTVMSQKPSKSPSAPLPDATLKPAIETVQNEHSNGQFYVYHQDQHWGPAYSSTCRTPPASSNRARARCAACKSRWRVMSWRPCGRGSANLTARCTSFMRNWSHLSEYLPEQPTALSCKPPKMNPMVEQPSWMLSIWMPDPPGPTWCYNILVPRRGTHLPCGPVHVEILV